MEEAPRVLVDSVSFTYEEMDHPALEDIDLRVNPGEFVAVLGHNGSGKSTLAKLLNALYVPSEGKVLICGMDTQNDDLTYHIRQRAGMIFQNPDNQLVASIVREDVAFGLENLGVPTEDMPARIESALSAVRMNEYAENAPHTLSGGQKQRVAIAGILAMEPSILIADESTAMLDPSGRREVLDTVMRLNRQKGITVVWITHYMEEAAQADRVLVIHQGRLVRQGTPREVFEEVDEMRSMRLDVPQMASLAHDLRADGMPLPKGILTAEQMAEEVYTLLCPSK